MIDNQLVHESRQTPPWLYHKQLSESITELCFFSSSREEFKTII